MFDFIKDAIENEKIDTALLFTKVFKNRVK